MYKFIVALFLLVNTSALFADYNIRIAVYENLSELRHMILKVKVNEYIQQTIIEKRNNRYYAYAYFPNKKEAKKALKAYKKVFSDAFISIHEVYEKKVVLFSGDVKTNSATEMTIKREPKKPIPEAFKKAKYKVLKSTLKKHAKASKTAKIKKVVKKKKLQSVAKKTSTPKHVHKQHHAKKPVAKKPVIKKHIAKKHVVKKKHVKKQAVKKHLANKAKIAKKKVAHKKVIAKKVITKKPIIKKPTTKKVISKKEKVITPKKSIATALSASSILSASKHKGKKVSLDAEKLLLDKTFYICTDKLSRNSDKSLVTMHFKKKYIEYKSKRYSKAPLHIEYSFYNEIVLLRVNGMRSAHILTEIKNKYFLMKSFIGKKKSDVLRYYFYEEDAEKFLHSK